MIGGNDVIGTVHAQTSEIYQQLFPNFQKEQPSKAGYEQEMLKLVKVLDDTLYLFLVLLQLERGDGRVRNGSSVRNSATFANGQPRVAQIESTFAICISELSGKCMPKVAVKSCGYHILSSL